MASEIWLTDGVVRVTTGTTTQPLTQAVEVSEFDQADLTLWIGGFEGTPGGGRASLTGTFSAATFSVRGMARSN